MNEEQYKKIHSTFANMKETGVAIKSTEMFDGESNLDPKTKVLYA